MAKKAVLLSNSIILLVLLALLPLCHITYSQILRFSQWQRRQVKFSNSALLCSSAIMPVKIRVNRISPTCQTSFATEPPVLFVSKLVELV